MDIVCSIFFNYSESLKAIIYDRLLCISKRFQPIISKYALHLSCDSIKYSDWLDLNAS